MHRWAKVSTAVVAACVVAASSASAQVNIQVTANVYQAIQLTGARPLDFGNVFPGVAKTINVGDATSGRWDATGQALANVNMSFTLPGPLAGPGGATLPIGTWTGCTNTTNTTSGCSSFSPGPGPIASAFGNPGNLFIWIGATVSPAAGQAAGSYSGTATLTLTYF